MTQRHLQKFRATEFKMLRHVLGLHPPGQAPRRDRDFEGDLLDDKVADFFSCAHRQVDFWRQKYGYLRWDGVALTRVFNWAGHVARFAHWAPGRIALKALQYRDARYLQQVQQLFGHQCHYRSFHAWRWEMQFTKTFGPHWHSLARDAEVWADHKTIWLTTRANDTQW